MFEIPSGLEALQRFLLLKHVDLNGIRSLRELARISQKLAKTFVKLPSDRSQSLYPTCRAIQSAILGRWPHLAESSANDAKKEERWQKAIDRPLSRKEKLAASKAVGWVRGVAARKFDPAAERAYRDSKLGTFGAAGPVKRIDPAELARKGKAAAV